MTRTLRNKPHEWRTPEALKFSQCQGVRRSSRKTVLPWEAQVSIGKNPFNVLIEEEMNREARDEIRGIALDRSPNG